MSHEDYKEMLPAQALSALDAVDTRALNQHLMECDECRRELADWENTAAALALSPNPAEPSRHVRERIMNAVRNEKQPRSESRIVSFPQSRRDKWSSLGPVGAIAAAVLFLVLIIWIIVLVQQNRALHRRYEDLAEYSDLTEWELSRSREFVEILSTPGAKVTPLQGTGEGSSAKAQLVYDKSGRVMLLVNDLLPAPAGKEYQLWFIVGKNPRAGRTFTPDAMGRGGMTDQMPREAIDSAVFAVTLEPTGGSLSPTGEIYLRSGL